MKAKIIVKFCLTIFFLVALVLNISLSPFSLMSDKAIASTTTTTTSSSNPWICKASVDCDMIIGGGNVTCYNYTPGATCTSYPLLHKVVCDGRTSFCQNF